MSNAAKSSRIQEMSRSCCCCQWLGVHRSEPSIMPYLYCDVVFMWSDVFLKLLSSTWLHILVATTFSTHLYIKVRLEMRWKPLNSLRKTELLERGFRFYTHLCPAYNVTAVTRGTDWGVSGSGGWQRTLGRVVDTWIRGIEGVTSTITGKSSLFSRFSFVSLQVLSTPKTVTE